LWCRRPDILWIRDTDGDGKADKWKNFTPAGQRDTHAVINNPRWATMAGFMRRMVQRQRTCFHGDKSKTSEASVPGVRFKPDGSAIEQYSSKGGNTWGLDSARTTNCFTRSRPARSGDALCVSENQLARGRVGNTASYKPMIRAAKVYPLLTYNQQAYVQIDWVGSFTAAAGCAIYSGAPARNGITATSPPNRPSTSSTTK